MSSLAVGIAHHHPTGLSSGVLARLRGAWDSLVGAALGFSPFAVELSALSEPELDPLERFLGGAGSLPFRYVAVHAPTKERRLAEGELASRLGSLPRSVRSIVTHPDSIGEPSAYRGLGRRLCVENMDRRKDFGVGPEDLDAIFGALPRAGFVFDIAHAHDADPSLALAGELLDRFGPRLRHVHLSSLRDGRHVSLTVEDEESFAPLLRRCADVPWILEAPPPERWKEPATPR